MPVPSQFDYTPLYALLATLREVDASNGKQPPLPIVPTFLTENVPWQIKPTKRGEFDYFAYPFPLYVANKALWEAASRTLDAGLPWPLGDGVAVNTQLIAYDPLQYPNDAARRQHLTAIFSQVLPVKKGVAALAAGLKVMDPNYPITRPFPWVAVTVLVGLVGIGLFKIHG